MKTILFILFTGLLSPEHSVSLQQARLVFEQAPLNEQKATDFLAEIAATKNNTLIGYKGALTMIMAKHTMNPFKKLDCFNTGKSLLEQALKNEPNNIELHYLRFSIQCNAPAFLDYNNQKESDKLFLLKQANSVKDADLKSRMIQFLLQCPALSAKEKLNLHQTL